MTLTLTTEAEELLRSAMARHPGQSAEEVVEQALRSSLCDSLSDEVQGTGSEQQGRTPEEFREWLDALRKDAKPAPHLAGETFSREMIYQDHD